MVIKRKTGGIRRFYQGNSYFPRIKEFWDIFFQRVLLMGEVLAASMYRCKNTTTFTIVYSLLASQKSAL